MRRDKVTPSEDGEQEAVCQWMDILNITYMHIPNEGKRSPAAAALLKKIGLKPGFPDLFILEPRNGYHGLAVEMKRIGGRVSENQWIWIHRLNSKGYVARVCYGADEAIALIKKYLTGQGEFNGNKT